MSNYPSITLHHYTSGSGLLGIISSDSIWATQIHYLNDSKELIHAVGLAKSSLQELRKGRSGDKFAQICAAVSKQLDSISRLALYVACFSEVKDSLSQWRGYCPPSFGYSLGFDGDRLATIAKQQGFQLRPCIYEINEQLENLRLWAYETVAALHLNCPEKEDPAEYTQRNSSIFLESFVAIAPFMKNHSFKDEKEWRMVGLVLSTDPKVNLRVGKTFLIPYVPIKLNSKEQTSPIWNICVGPTPHIELSLNSISHLLFQRVKIINGIEHTKIPYRDW